jgi:hypothetical protein
MIAEFLENHMNAPFPPGAHELDIPGVELELLDADVVGLAQSYLRQARLTAEQQGILNTSVEELRRVLPELPQEMRDYFARLHALAMSVLNELPVRGLAR